MSKCVECTTSVSTKCDTCDTPLCVSCFDGQSHGSTCVRSLAAIGKFVDYNNPEFNECIDTIWKILGTKKLGDREDAKRMLLKCATQVVDFMSLLLPEEKTLMRHILPIEGVVKISYKEMGSAYVKADRPWMVFELDDENYEWGTPILQYKVLRMGGILIAIMYGITLARWLHHRSSINKMVDRFTSYEQLDAYIYKLHAASRSADTLKLLSKKAMTEHLGPLFTKFIGNRK